MLLIVVKPVHTDYYNQARKSISELYNKTKSNIDIISLIIPAILLKYNRECPYKNPDIIVFL
jgi:hypothetical protein